MRVDPLYSLTIPTSLDALTSQQNQLTQQLSSGVAVSSPGDNPLAAASAVRMSSAIAQQDAYVQAASGVESRMQAADSALGSAVTQITSAISLAVQGMGGTLDASNLQSVGQQMAGLRDEVLSLANSSYAGNYLFGGTAAAAPPFTNDTSTSPATATYNGDTNSQITVTPGGQRIATSVPGSSVFTASGADVLNSLNRLVADFSSGTVSASAASDLAELRSGLSALTAQRTVLGSGLSTIQSTSTYAQTEETNLRASQSTLVSTDVSQVAAQLSSNETQQQALMAVFSSLNKTDLFDNMN